MTLDQQFERAHAARQASEAFAAARRSHARECARRAAYRPALSGTVQAFRASVRYAASVLRRAGR